MKANRAHIMKDEGAQISALMGGVMAVVITVLGVLIGLQVLAPLTGTFFDSVEGINDNLTDANTTTGDATADSLLSVFPIIIGITGLLVFVGLVFVVFRQ